MELFKRPNTFQNLFQKQEIEDEDAIGDQKNHGVVICGHRGGCGTGEPENTLRAF